MKNETLKCRFCQAELPELANFVNADYQRCGCGAVYGFEDETDGFEFACQAADMLGIPDGEPMGRIEKLEIRSEEYDILTNPDVPDDHGEEWRVFFARRKQ